MVTPEQQTESGGKVLLVEDDGFIVRAYRDGLERAHFSVTTANNGVEAMEKVRADRPDIILLDMILPEKNGFEVLEELHLDPQLASVPVIILTNLGQESDIKKGKELGAVDYLIKADVSLKEVVERVKHHLAEVKK